MENNFSANILTTAMEKLGSVPCNRIEESNGMTLILGIPKSGTHSIGYDVLLATIPGTLIVELTPKT